MRIYRDPHVIVMTTITTMTTTTKTMRTTKTTITTMMTYSLPFGLQGKLIPHLDRRGGRLSPPSTVSRESLSPTLTVGVDACRPPYFFLPPNMDRRRAPPSALMRIHREAQQAAVQFNPMTQEHRVGNGPSTRRPTGAALNHTHKWRPRKWCIPVVPLGAPIECTEWCIPVVPLGTAVDLSGASKWSHSARLLSAPMRKGSSGASQWFHSVRLATFGFGWVVAVFLVGWLEVVHPSDPTRPALFGSIERTVVHPRGPTSYRDDAVRMLKARIVRNHFQPLSLRWAGCAPSPWGGIPAAKSHARI